MRRSMPLLVAFACLLAVFAGCRRVATIEVNSTPEGADIFLDGESTGFITPHTFADVYAGYHLVEVRSEYSTWQESFTLARNEVRAVSAVLPRVRWQFRTGEYGLQVPAVGDDGTVYLTCGDSLYALDSTGTLRWQVRCADPYATSTTAPVVADDGTVLVAAWDSLRAFQPDGSLAWACELQSSPATVPALGSNGTVYVVTYDSLLAIAPGGTRRWTAHIGDPYAAPPAIGPDGTVYLRTGYAVYAFHAAGTRLWTYSRTSSDPGPLAIGPDSTIYAASSYELFALSRQGSSLWTTPLSQYGGYSSGLAVGPDGTAYTGTNHDFVAVSRAGTVVWRSDDAGGTWAPAVGSDGLVYAGRSSGSGFVCLTAAGETRWTFIPQDSYGGYVAGLGPDGTVYWVSGNGTIYAVSGTAGPPDSGWPMYQHDLRRTGRVR